MTPMKFFKYACVAIAGDWFTANEKGINLGCFGGKENKKNAKKMLVIFSEWIINGHNYFEDKNYVSFNLNSRTAFYFRKEQDTTYTLPSSYYILIYLLEIAVCKF